MTQQEYTALVDRAKQLSYEYYVLAAPSVSDAQFDALVSEIEQVESEHPEWTLADSPTQQVGSDVDPKSGRRLIRHRTRMLSCDKAKSQEAVTKWLSSTEKKLKGAQVYALEWKYDGISCSLVYQDGRLTEASTRGEGGIMGQDIFAHVAYIASVPQRINMTGRVEVRGEIVCPKAALTRLGYKDCRTAAAALTNQVCPSKELRSLVFIAWQMDSDEKPFGTESVSIVAAQQQGFLCDVRTCEGDAVRSLLDEYGLHRDGLEYPTDGVVIKVDDKRRFASLGATKHHPKGSVAYKFDVVEKVVTKVVSIEISIGETGRRTPRAILLPVTILGREVKSVSLGSEKKMKDLGVTEGCMVEVGLSNDVTPYIYRVIEDAYTDNTDSFSHTESTERACYTSPAESVPTETVADPMQEPADIEPENNQFENEEEAPIEEPAEEQPVYNDTELEQLQQENDALKAQIAQMQAQQSAERLSREETAHRSQPKRRPAPVRRQQPQAVAATIEHDSNYRQWLKVAGYLVAGLVAVLVIWQTGLLIPLGLIGLATSGILK